jgi:hypothetical protein
LVVESLVYHTTRNTFLHKMGVNGLISRITRSIASLIKLALTISQLFICIIEY